jgi:hypothetical protein
MLSMDTTITLPEDLFRKLESLSSKDGISVNEEALSVIEEGISSKRQRFLESIIDKHDKVLQRLA